MKPLGSIRWRLQVWYALLIGALVLGFALTAYRFERNLRLEQIDAELRRLAFDLNAVNRPPPARPRPPRPPVRVEDVYTPELAERGFYYALWTRNRAPFTASENAPADLARPADGPPAVRWVGTRREAYVIPNPGDVALVGRDLADDVAQLHRYAWELAGAAAVAWLGTLLIGAWLVGRALRPVHDIGAAAQKIATGDLSQRIDTTDTHSELGQLAAVLNSTFARLEAAFAQQARFTADAAHELRTPVAVMLTQVQNGLASDALAPEQREAFEACERAANRMRRLIESLLALARLDAGAERIEAKRMDLAEAAREGVALIQSLAATRQITVLAELEAAPCRADATRIAQVITNLLANAIHHNREGGEVRVQTHAAKDAAVLIVTDNGPGIASEHLPRIFERFYRVDKARTSTAGRTGLGLSISKAIVDAHGGTIEVASEEGKGATFVVRLPAGE